MRGRASAACAAGRDATPACPDAAGHDEDGDGIDDACDNCPTVANMDQANDLEVLAGQEADEVGDACDPNPTLGGDKILLFQAFTNAVGVRTSGAITFNPDDVVLAGDSFIATMMSPLPTKIG